ncbi:hypothetical protein BgAZ_106700 [Babesia gibsoni]|uniref:MerC domain-containing protein n=1 Tax=Babesia gibsoni TaxID=33632 RepID=A0AAD8UW81_BABGI|nr:hypothetical protein BgAZ_106700 [Babesia gibsoni]
MTTIELQGYNLKSHRASQSRIQRVGSFFLNYAGLLCLIDCIVLPVLIAVTGLLDLFPGIHEWEHVFHIVELCCVIPLGLLSVFVNYSKIKNLPILTLGLMGISAIVISHIFLEGLYETAMSLTGCAMLISSNYVARKKAGCDHCHEHRHTMLL